MYFKQIYSFEERKAESDKIRIQYSEKVPVICERTAKSTIPIIEKKKYLVPSDLTIGQFIYVIRKRIKLNADQSMFLFIRNIIPPTSALVGELFHEHKDEDGFLYISYSGENTFGFS